MRILGLALCTLAIVACGDNNRPKLSVGGTVTGLAGSGLVIADNNGDTLAISADGAFAFATPFADGAAYTVSVTHQPSEPTQACTVMNGTGTAAGSNVTDVQINCATSKFTVGGTVTGLVGTGMVLENNGGDDLAISADGTFSFATPVASGSTFAVTVKTQPTGPSQTCTVSGATGSIVAANVSTVVVNCATDTFTVGGTVIGLAATAVLQDNGGDNITISSNGMFAFPTPLQSGQTYAVTVLTQPSTPTQACVVTAGSGPVVDMNITTVVVTCTTQAFTIGVTVAGDAGTGLVLQNNGGDPLSIPSDGTYTFATPVLSGDNYDVTVATQPIDPYQHCTVTNGTNIVGGHNVTGILVNCATDTFAVSVSITGLDGSIDVQNNGGDDLVETADGTYAFATPIASGADYNVTIVSHTGVSQDCVLGNASGTIVDSNQLVTITCTTKSYLVGGTLTGLSSNESVVLENNGGDDLTLTADGAFHFQTPVASGQPYSVTVLTSPASPIAETCTVANGSNTVGANDITDITVTCAPTQFNIKAVVTGLTGGTLVLQDNGADDLAVSADGTFTFATPVASGSTYDVTISSQPAGLRCGVPSGSGTVAGTDISVSVVCHQYIAPLSGTNLPPVGGVGFFEGVTSDPTTGKVYVTPGYAGDSTVYEYANLGAFQSNTVTRTINVAVGWEGTYRVALNGFLYYDQIGTSSLVKADLATGAVVATATLAGAGHTNDAPFQWGGYSDIDLYLDAGNALYVFYAAPGYQATSTLARLDPDTLAVVQTWTVPRVKGNTGFAFIVEGVMYFGDAYYLPQINAAFSFAANSYDPSYTNSFTAAADYISQVEWDPASGNLYEVTNGSVFVYPNVH